MVWWQGALMTLKAHRGSTGGALGLIEARFPAGFGPPLHIHHREDEALYVLDGELHCRLGDQELTAGLGQLVFGPRELAHTFKAGPSGARALVLLTPAGFKQMFQEGGIPAHTPPRHRPGLRRPTGDPAVGQVRHGRHRPAAHLTASGQLSDRSEKHALVLRRHWYWRDYGRHR
jgi:quercetin dioxygenase-like cupin family protein